MKRHTRSSHANATPATDGTHVVAFFGSEGLFVYDMAGTPIWQRDLGVLDAGYVGMPEFQWETASSPLIYRNLVIVQCDSRRDSFVAAFDLPTGREVWRSPREENPSWATPIVASVGGRDLLITSSPHYFRGLDPMTGKEVRRFADRADVKVPTPVTAHGLVYVAGGAPQGRQFYAIRPTGSGDISPGQDGSSPYLAWRVDKGGPYTPTPIVVGDHLYVLGDMGILSCYDARTGQEVYRHRVSPAGGTYNASPVAANGHAAPLAARRRDEVHLDALGGVPRNRPSHAHRLIVGMGEDAHELQCGPHDITWNVNREPDTVGLEPVYAASRASRRVSSSSSSFIAAARASSRSRTSPRFHRYDATASVAVNSPSDSLFRVWRYVSNAWASRA